MIVYGDRERTERTVDAFARLRAAACDPTQAGHAGRVSLAIECGMVAQALLDDQLERLGCDELSPLTEAAARLTHAAGAPHGADTGALMRALDALEARASPTVLCLREPEGYAFYALYPELYLAVARALPVHGEDTQVIGIRSIGTSLAGFVAAALGSTRPPFSVRPRGHPFARSLRVGAKLCAALLGGGAAERVTYVIVDEGPGLSGSSFVAVADWLAAHGVDRARIVFLPSHSGEPGPEARPEVRASYRASRRETVPFERCFGEPELARWFAEITGPLTAPVRDLSGGRWRPLLYPDPGEYPPSHVRDERRKYLLEGAGQRWLMKYIGLGHAAEARVARARVLSAAGFTPELCGAHHGFVLSRFHAEGVPLPRARDAREALVPRLADYLALLARSFPSRDPLAGARPDALLALAVHNSAQLLDPERAAAVQARFGGLLGGFAHAPVAGDAKLDAHEWLLLPGGRLVKCDAEAHHAGHDCIGCQDPAWDVAGASVELSLTEAERELVLRALLDRAGLRRSAAQLQFYELAYLAFRAGSAHYAERALAGWADDDATRFGAARARYTARLAALLT